MVISYPMMLLICMKHSTDFNIFCLCNKQYSIKLDIFSRKQMKSLYKHLYYVSCSIVIDIIKHE